MHPLLHFQPVRLLSPYKQMGKSSLVGHSQETLSGLMLTALWIQHLFTTMQLVAR
jgi:hypothetical protein